MKVNVEQILGNFEAIKKEEDTKIYDRLSEVSRESRHDVFARKGFRGTYKTSDDCSSGSKHIRGYYAVAEDFNIVEELYTDILTIDEICYLDRMEAALQIYVSTGEFPMSKYNLERFEQTIVDNIKLKQDHNNLLDEIKFEFTATQEQKDLRDERLAKEYIAKLKKERKEKFESLKIFDTVGVAREVFKKTW